MEMRAFNFTNKNLFVQFLWLQENRAQNKMLCSGYQGLTCHGEGEGEEGVGEREAGER